MIKKTALMLLLPLCLLLCGLSLADGQIQQGTLLVLQESEISLAIPSAYEYIGEYQEGVHGYRHADGDVALLLTYSDQTSLEEFSRSFGDLSLQTERVLDSAYLQADINWVDHPSYPAFIAVWNPQKPEVPLFEITVLRKDEQVDVREKTREVARGIRSLAEVRSRISDPAAWNSYAPFGQLGLALVLPDSMVMEKVMTEDGTEGYIHITDGICHLLVGLYRCTIGELGSMKGFTSREYEIFQSNSYGCWEYRRINPDVSEFTHLAFPGKDGTWLLLSVYGLENTTVYELLDYVEMLYTAVGEM